LLLSTGGDRGGGDLRAGVEDLKYPLGGGGALFAGGEHVAERLDRPGQLQGQGDEGDQRAYRSSLMVFSMSATALP
jgi:hypothetical protein